MKPDNTGFLKHTRRQLDESADSLDAATRSKLNQARQKALQSHRSDMKTMSFKLPLAAAASVGIAVFAGWLVLSQPDHSQLDELAYVNDDLNMLVSDTELELLEQLEFVSWLVEQDIDENNAG